MQIIWLLFFNLDKLPSPSNLSSYRTQGQQPLTATNLANQLCRPLALDRVQGRHPNAKALLVPGSFLPQLFPKTMKLPQLCNVSSTCDIVAASRHLWLPNALMLKNQGSPLAMVRQASTTREMQLDAWELRSRVYLPHQTCIRKKKKSRPPSAQLSVTNTGASSVLVNKHNIHPYNILMVSNINHMLLSLVHKQTNTKPTGKQRGFYKYHSTNQLVFVDNYEIY